MVARSFDLQYGDSHVRVSVPEESIIGVIGGKPAPVVPDIPAAVREAIAHPVGSLPLREIVKPGEKVVILVSDLTRAWCRSDLMTPAIVDELNTMGIPDDDITVVIAVGSHRGHTEAEIEKLVSPEIKSRVRVVEHDCKEADMVYLGTTSRGTPVSLNAIVVNADRLILTGGIVTHFLAGYGGGMKSLIPGVASYETIMTHHRVSLGVIPGTINDDLSCGKTAGSVFYEDMVEGAHLAKPDFLVNSVLNPDGKIGRIVAGDPVTAHLAGSASIDEWFSSPIEELADLVIASCGGFPKDINFYQTSKSLYNAAMALKPGGTMILLSESREAFGHPFVELIATGFPDNAARHRHMLEDYDIGKWVGFMMTVYAEKYNILIMSSLSDEQVRTMGMTPVHSMDEAVLMAAKRLGSSPRTYVIPHAGSVWPRPR